VFSAPVQPAACPPGAGAQGGRRDGGACGPSSGRLKDVKKVVTGVVAVRPSSSPPGKHPGRALLLGAVAWLAFCDESPALRHGVDQAVLTQ
jgi:hypothetical protein